MEREGAAVSDDGVGAERLYAELHRFLGGIYPHVRKGDRVYRHSHTDEVRCSWADIGKARRLLGYSPTHCLGDGIAESMPWYSGRLMAQAIPDSH